ncbi:cobalamin B12-binding domain-containing protein [bacterium]|nr:cobalamin B12-binding domain-containing protein [bacterium]
MHWKLIYPKWRKLEGQTHFDLPPHGPVVFAAALPAEVEIEFVDENVQDLELGDRPDAVALSVMLTAQLPRAFEIADHYRRMGVPVLAGGISATLHADEFGGRVDSVFLGEAEGRMEAVVRDLQAGQLRPVYDFLRNPPPIELVGPARREILNADAYTYRGVKMVDLVHASRGCRFNCFPCCTGFLGGRIFRPRPIDKVVEEIASISNNRLFVVDNSLAQDSGWERELFQALIPLRKKWVSHPIEDDDEIIDLAYRAGCWYVYQAVFDTSDFIRRRIKRYHDHGIGVEATVILGTDQQDADYIRRLVDFLLEVRLDLAEFTILTPFAQSPIRHQFEAEGRMLDRNPANYTCDRVVFQPKQMTPSELQDMFYYAWDTFYAEAAQELRMGRLFNQVIRREMEDGTFQRPARVGRSKVALAKESRTSCR